MLHIVFFARVKEQLGCAALELEWQDSLASIEAVREKLCASSGQQWREVLYEENIICAVNQTIVAADARVCDNDEIAFFPPVTGG
jgi:molybdopterin synthase sulfur carrier subunit